MTPSVCLLGFLHSDPTVLHDGGVRQGPRATPARGSQKGDQVKMIMAKCAPGLGGRENLLHNTDSPRELLTLRLRMG